MMNDPNNPSNPSDTSETATEGRVKVFNGQTPIAEDDIHFSLWANTLYNTGVVDMLPEDVGRAWHVQAFNEHPGGDFGGGIWAVFDQPVSFKAGDSLWLTPSLFMRRPRIVIG